MKRGGACGCNVQLIRGGGLPAMGSCNGACELTPAMAAQLGGGGKKKRKTCRRRPANRANAETLRKYRAGKEIGFSRRSSLKAKGLIPRVSGRCEISDKYKK